MRTLVIVLQHGGHDVTCKRSIASTHKQDNCVCVLHEKEMQSLFECVAKALSIFDVK